MARVTQIEEDKRNQRVVRKWLQQLVINITQAVQSEPEEADRIENRT